MTRKRQARGVAASFTMATMCGAFAALAMAVPSCKPRQFNEGKAASSSGGALPEDAFFADGTSDSFRNANPKLKRNDLAGAARVAWNFVDEASGPSGADSASLTAETLSALHQKDLLKILEKENEEFFARIAAAAKFDGGPDEVKNVFLCGVADTDKGKLARYKTLLLPQTQEAPEKERKSANKSDWLFNVLRGRKLPETKKAVAVLEKYLLSMGFPEGAWILNPAEDVSNAELRALFAQYPILANWMHELPGIADAGELFRAGVIDDERIFRETLAISLFHNGPAQGYWKTVTHDLLPKYSSPDAVSKLLSGTIYLALGPRQEAPSGVGYPAPRTFLGVVHTVLDRLSQGTRGGVHKIWQEIQGFTKTADIAKQLLLENQQGTLEQLAALAEHVQDLSDKNEIDAEQAALLADLTAASRERVEKLQSWLVKGTNPRVKFGLGRVTLRTASGAETFSNEQPSQTPEGVPSHKSLALAKTLALLDDEERENGDAIMAALKSAEARASSRSSASPSSSTGPLGR